MRCRLNVKMRFTSKINFVYNEDYPIYREHNVLGVNEKMDVKIEKVVSMILEKYLAVAE